MTSARFLTINDVAEMLGVRRERVSTLIRGGEIAAADISPVGSKRPRYRIAADAVDAFIQRRSVARPVATPARRPAKSGRWY